MEFELNFFWLLIDLVTVFSLILGIYLRWDKLPESKMATLDPDRLARDLIDDTELTEEERGFMKEVAALELTRRHLIC
tara:strand:+ start:7552 stop:7785 length:234 start_codon:yes stop_codon:yes gene_type:complete